MNGKVDDLNHMAGRARRVVRRADDECVRVRENREKRAVLTFRGPDGSIGRGGPHIVFARAIGRDFGGKWEAPSWQGCWWQSLHGGEHGSQEDMTANH